MSMVPDTLHGDVSATIARKAPNKSSLPRTEPRMVCDQPQGFPPGGESAFISCALCIEARVDATAHKLK